jgi:hypothetical protein
MWLWIVAAFVCLLLFILLILCIPFDLFFSITINENPAYRLRLLWLFGLLDRELRKTERKPKKKQRVAETTKKPKHRIDASTVYRILRTRGLWAQLKRLVTGIYKSLDIKELTAYLKVGLENPADTGLLFAIAGPANFLLSLLPYRITIYPSFEGDIVFEAHAQGITRLHPIMVLVALLKFLFSSPAMYITRIFVVSRWKRA